MLFHNEYGDVDHLHDETPKSSVERVLTETKLPTDPPQIIAQKNCRYIKIYLIEIHFTSSNSLPN